MIDCSWFSWHGRIVWSCPRRPAQNWIPLRTDYKVKQWNIEIVDILEQLIKQITLMVPTRRSTAREVRLHSSGHTRAQKYRPNLDQHETSVKSTINVEHIKWGILPSPEPVSLRISVIRSILRICENLSSKVTFSCSNANFFSIMNLSIYALSSNQTIWHPCGWYYDYDTMILIPNSSTTSKFLSIYVDTFDLYILSHKASSPVAQCQLRSKSISNLNLSNLFLILLLSYMSSIYIK